MPDAIADDGTGQNRKNCRRISKYQIHDRHTYALEEPRACKPNDRDGTIVGFRNKAAQFRGLDAAHVVHVRPLFICFWQSNLLVDPAYRHSTCSDQMVTVTMKLWSYGDSALKILLN